MEERSPHPLSHLHFVSFPSFSPAPPSLSRRACRFALCPPVSSVAFCPFVFTSTFFSATSFSAPTHSLITTHTHTQAHTHTFYSPHPRLWVPFRRACHRLYHCVSVYLFPCALSVCVCACVYVRASQWGCINGFQTSFSLHLSDEQYTVLLGRR